MAYDYQGLVNDVLLELNEPELTSETAFNNAVGFHKFAKNAVNWAINYIYKEEDWRWTFLFDDSSFTTTSGQGDIGNPYNPQNPLVSYDWDSFYIVASPGDEITNQKLIPLDLSEYVSSYMDKDINNSDVGIRSKPRYVVRTKNNEVVLSPVPDQEYIVQFNYFDVPAQLVSITDTVPIPEAFKDVIVKGALVRCYAFRGDENMYKLHLEEFKDDINAMRRLFIPQEEGMKYIGSM